MNKYQKITVYISAVVLVFFLLLSIFTGRWGFFLWSLLPVFMNLSVAFTVKDDKQSRKKDSAK